MARKQKKFGTVGEARFLALAESGATEEVIVAELAALGVKVARSTIGNRLRATRGTVAAPRVSARSEAPPVAKGGPAPVDALSMTKEDIERAPAGTLDDLLSTFEAALKDAEEKKNFANMGAAGRLILATHEAKRKAERPAPPDPNENPDMVKLGAEVFKRYSAMVDLVVPQ